MKKKGATFIDLFAGIGGFHFALHDQGAECVFASEWDEKCRNTYEENFKLISPKLFEMKPFTKTKGTLIDGLLSKSNFAGDITKISPKDIPSHDILCAGFPCQPFSISGRQKGFDDIRGTLFFNVMEIIKAKQPKVVFLENVKHLIHHDHGNTLRVILKELEDSGYKPEWKLLNAKDFGLAQNRERIVIIANKDKRFDFSKIKYTPGTTINDILETKGTFELLEQEDYTILPKELWKKQLSGLIFCGYRNKSIRKSGTRPNTNHLSRVHKQPNRIYHIDGTHPTLPSQETSGRFWIYDGKRVRKLTINECYRLQGFPDSFKKNKMLSASYNQIGNSVAIPMIEAIYQQIKEQYL
jgi:DNA (cytosine-5)-methyltransferase 1